MRWFPFAAWVLCFVALILSFVTLLAGVTGDSLENAAIITFNVSYLGMSDYRNPSSELGKNIAALVPSHVSNPPSITRYLGVKDWYSMHYLSVCEGYWAPDPTGTGLTSTKVNTTCTSQSSGYSFSLVTHVQNELDPTVQGLADKVTATSSYRTAPWVGFWYVGIVLAFVEILLLPLTFEGTRRINRYTFVLSIISYICFNIPSGLTTGHIDGINRFGYGPYSETFVGLTWATTVCMILICILVQAEWRFEIWTFIGDPITIYRKPKKASWFMMAALMNPEVISGKE